MPNTVLLPILYAGLAGTVLALIIATGQQRWSLRVLFLLALRLAIGWHFFFEGMHKIHSHHAGASEGTRAFSSEMYFKLAPGPLGPVMSKQFSDPTAVIDAKVRAPQNISPADFAKKTVEEQAAVCPPAVAQELDVPVDQVEAAIKAEADSETKAADAAEKKADKDAAAAEEKAVKAAKTDADKTKAKAKADADRAKAKAQADKDRAAAKKMADSAKELAPARITAAKAAYARWVYGVDGRDTKLKGINGDAAYTGPERLAHIDRLRQMAKAEQDRIAEGLGNGYGIDQKKAAELRTDVITAESDLAKDANAFAADLRKELTGGKAEEKPAERSTGQRMDTVTMWALVVIGGCLMGGLFTRVMCVLAAGFLVMTYLAHPPFPWFPLPPNTEGNPLFINKNVIEALALLTIATFPTGRWLGLDALLGRLCGCGRRDAAPTA
jgi:uncharacterized membrane protein YphA (DoxX/SURF4 family)